MRRAPLLATALVLIAVAVMIALGMWQLRRAEWKETLTARAAGNLLEATADLPSTLPPGLDYRRFRVSCERIEYLQPKAGTGRGGTSGWLQPAACVRRPGDDRVTIGLGITERPERALPRGTANSYTGRVLHSGTESANQYILYAEQPPTGLIPVAQPTPEMANTTTPEGHRGYAMQWFLFAATAVAIYGLALRRRWQAGRE